MTVGTRSSYGSINTTNPKKVVSRCWTHFKGQTFVVSADQGGKVRNDDERREVGHLSDLQSLEKRSESFGAETKRFLFDADLLIAIMDKRKRRLGHSMMHAESRLQIFHKSSHKRHKVFSSSDVARDRL